MLLDREYFQSQDRDNSSQHQLAWCIAFVTGARPGSLAQMTDRADTMCWRDWEITRDPIRGHLVARVVFRCWKGGWDGRKSPYAPIV